MVGMALLIATQRDLLVSHFMSADLPVNSEIAELALSFLEVAALIEVADRVQVVCTGMLRGWHDTRWLMIFAVTGYSVVGIGLQPGWHSHATGRDWVSGSGWAVGSLSSPCWYLGAGYFGTGLACFLTPVRS
ncbi:hypothetical protein SmB9_00800 [Sphingosinicella microcystinivorans]|nr:hypothetical protein SmB9_00800 [Sphingosinicella microcystinivorans]